MGEKRFPVGHRRMCYNPHMSNVRTSLLITLVLALSVRDVCGEDVRETLDIRPLTLAAAASTAGIPLEDLSLKRNNGRHVRTRGYVRNVFRDDIDPDYVFIVLQDGDVQAHAICAHCETPISLVGSEIIIEGTCRNVPVKGSRRYLPRTLFFSPTNEILVVSKPFADAGVPVLETDRNLPADEILRLGLRRTVGRVLAVIGMRKILIRTDKGAFVKAELTNDSLPAIGACVELAGFPTTDFYFMNLTSARWQPSEADLPPEPPATPLSAAQLYTDSHGHSQIPNTDYHGRHISLSGTLRHLPSGSSPVAASGNRAFIDDGGYLIPVLYDSCPNAFDGIAVGSEVRLTGVCVVEVANWYPGAPFPLVTGISLALPSGGDVTVLRTPPWWTARKLALLVVALAAILLFIAVWNVLLQRKSEKRGHILARSRLAQYGAQLRLGERTRLAVELHDSLSQTLAGIAMEVGTVLQLSDKADPELVRRLDHTLQTIDACRRDLRLCLGDLRSHALESHSIEEAIRLTLSQSSLLSASVAIRFPVPRHYLNDNLVHNTLCIVRELVSNALRHGRANAVRIAGSIDAGRLLFSVRDDGCGFDPARAPGVREGHFGLLGIRERVRRLDGEWQLDSLPGRGVHARFSIPLSRNEEGGNCE